MKLLIFGGAFDPPHNGHISLLKNAIDKINPDKIIVVPTGTATHKIASQTLSAVRFSMCEDFLSVDKKVQLSDFEIKSESKNYTLSTVRHFKTEFPDAKIYIVIGSDMLMSFKTWHDYKNLLSEATILVQSRDETETISMNYAAEELRNQGGEIIILNTKVVELSSSEIRLADSQGVLDKLVPPITEKTIRRLGLYR